MLDFLFGNAGLLAGGAMSGLALWLLKKVPNEKIAGGIEKVCIGLGRTLTLGLSKWKLTKGIWNKVIEPWFIDLIDNVIGSAVKGFIKGLRSD